MRLVTARRLLGLAVVTVVAGCGAGSAGIGARSEGSQAPTAVDVPTSLEDVNATARALASSAAAEAPTPTVPSAPTGKGRLVVVDYFGDAKHRRVFQAACWEVDGAVNVASGLDLKVTQDGVSHQTYMGPATEGGAYAFIQLPQASSATGPDGLTATPADPWPDLSAGASWTEGGQERGIVAPTSEYLQSVTIKVAGDYRSGDVHFAETPPATGEPTGWTMTWSCT